MENSATVEPPDEMELWIMGVHQKLANVSQMRVNRSIFRTPERLQLKDADPYKPHIVSIGPYHHEDPHLKAMEEHKWRYAKSLLSRAGYDDQGKTLRDCSNAVLRFEKDIRDYYAETISYEKFDKRKLVDMILLDGCFMLEVFLRYSEMNSEHSQYTAFTSPWMSDFIVETPRMILALQRDFTLLENQIPFFVLEDLFNYTIGFTSHDDAKYNLTKLILSFFKHTLGFGEEDIRKNCNLRGSHLLDLLHNFFVPWTEDSSSSSGRRRRRKLIPCATSLRQGGATFSRGKIDNLFEIKFNNGEVEIPQLRMDDLTCSLLMNFAALEQCLLSTTYYATSYIFLMSCLIQSSEDRKLLERKRIIKIDGMHNRKGNLSIFREIGPSVFVKDFFYAGICEKLTEHHMPTGTYSTSRLVYELNKWKKTAYLPSIFLILLAIARAAFLGFNYYANRQYSGY